MGQRQDCYGGYYSRGCRVFQVCRKEALELSTVKRHIAATRAVDLIGFYTTTVDDACQRFCVDIDAHEGQDDDPTANERYSIALWLKLKDLLILVYITERSTIPIHSDGRTSAAGFAENESVGSSEPPRGRA